MAKQLHKRFSTEEVKMFMREYLKDKKKLPYILQILQISKRRFFQLVQEYRENPDELSIDYQRKKPTRKIDGEIENNIIKELRIEKQLIEDEELPIQSYNYSYIKDQLYNKYKQEVSLPTIISRAKEMGFYKSKDRKRKPHDREVQSEYVGQLIQHDSSYHKFSPYAQRRWYLVTSLDDFSRLLLYYKLIERETSWGGISWP